MVKALKHRKVLGVNITVSPKKEVLEYLSYCLKNRDKIFIVTPNPEILVESSKDESFKKILNKADVAIPDGVGLALAGVRGRILGRELFQDLLDLAASKNLKVYLLGAKNEVNALATKKAAKIYPNILIKGCGDFMVSENGEIVSESNIKIYKDIISDINSFAPDLLFVAFGAPKQEKWIYNNLEKLNVKIVMAVGGTFDYFVGKMAKPPDVMEKLGLEWLWRLIQEPSRVGRIFNALVVFPLLVLRARISRRE